ncbi:hypothetical protein ACF0H5_016225 [Mactra antiquata]
MRASLCADSSSSLLLGSDEHPCGVECESGQTCDISSKTCIYKECNNMTVVNNSTKFGNMRSVESREMTKCEDNFTMVPEENLYSYCENNGQWYPPNGTCYKKVCYNAGVCFAELVLTDIYGFDTLKARTESWQDCAAACDGTDIEYKSFVFCPNVDWKNNCFCKNVTVTDGKPITSITYGDLYHKLLP